MKRRKPRSRYGAITVAVLVCLVVTMSILLGAMQTTLRHRRQMRTDFRMEQTQWLLDAGVRSAIRKLNEQPDYPGETLTLNSAIARNTFGSVEIKVVAPSKAGESGVLRVTARLDSALQGSQTNSVRRWRKAIKRTAEIDIPARPEGQGGDE